MKVQYANKFIRNIVLGYIITCIYQFIFNENDSNDTNIMQYFIMHELGLWIKLDNHVTHMLYACPFIHNTAVPIAINKNKYFLSLNTYTSLCDWGDSTSNKIELNN